MIVLPSMPPEQTSSWLGLLDLHERLADALLLEIPDAEDSLARLTMAGDL
ncbi:hypothetical protein [Nocardioides daeguensis]|uniref:Uncharacterized protein n=1 Tax=Nocardioides daeguensis TaxID=908359 RepID=A0ABP6UW92_9ACTN|nr:hypothetical protein [Nocardioides daeguensis]MBV6725578.1 hypothetical protein [Nocardioides daeguensis]MCR1771438.1 hypothetical protein [Nocardioides daeguensis]